MSAQNTNQLRPRRVYAHRDFLQTAVEERIRLTTGEIKLGLRRLQPEIARRIKSPPSAESESFVASAVRALQHIKNSSNIELRVQCLFDCAIYSYNNGNTSGFLKAIDLLDDLRPQTNPGWNRRILMFGGVCHADIGDVAEAIMRYAQALAIAREEGDISGEVATLCNLGGALNYGGLYREAIPPLRLAIRLAHDHHDIVDDNVIEGQRAYFQCVALTNMAQTYYNIGNHDAAFDAIARCLSLTPAPVSSLSATNLMVRVFTFVNISIELGLWFEAKARIAEVLQYKSQAGARGQFMLEVSQAIWEAHGGKSEDGIRRLESLHAQAELPSTRTAVLRALARAYDLSFQPSKALSAVEMLIGAIRETRSKAVDVLLSALPSPKVGALSSEIDDLGALHLARAEYKAKAAETELQSARIEALERLAIAADLKEEATGGHGHRVGRLASIFASTIGWGRAACHSIDLAGRLHDIGKIGLPDRLMLKPATLVEAERRFVAAHSEIGPELLAQGKGSLFQMARDVARCHHEKWDGSGYPRGLRGADIPISARIVALADVFDAMTHGRPYSAPLSTDSAIALIQTELGQHFDPNIGQLFVKFIVDLISRHGELDRFLGESDQNTAFTEARKRIDSLLRRANSM